MSDRVTYVLFVVLCERRTVQGRTQLSQSTLPLKKHHSVAGLRLVKPTDVGRLEMQLIKIKI